MEGGMVYDFWDVRTVTVHGKLGKEVTEKRQED